MSRWNEDDLDDTARLIFMESPECSMRDFAAQMKETHGVAVGLAEIGSLWRRYRGWDGRVPPTHYVESGQRR